MAERRSLSQGLTETPKALDPAREEQFVYGRKPQPPAAPPSAPGLTPISTRLRADFITALKRASLERQLEGREPNTLRDILEEAIEPWLRSHGYLS